MEWVRVLKASEKIFNVEYSRPGDEYSDFITTLKVKAIDEENALEIAKEKRPNGYNFKIVDKSAINSDIIDRESQPMLEEVEGYWDGETYRRD